MPRCDPFGPALQPRMRSSAGPIDRWAGSGVGWPGLPGSVSRWGRGAFHGPSSGFSRRAATRERGRPSGQPRHLVPLDQHGSVGLALPPRERAAVPSRLGPRPPSRVEEQVPPAVDGGDHQQARVVRRPLDRAAFLGQVRAGLDPVPSSTSMITKLDSVSPAYRSRLRCAAIRVPSLDHTGREM